MGELTRVIAYVTTIKGDLQRVDVMLRGFETKLGVDGRNLQSTDALVSSRTDNLNEKVEGLTTRVMKMESEKEEMIKEQQRMIGENTGNKSKLTWVDNQIQAHKIEVQNTIENLR